MYCNAMDNVLHCMYVAFSYQVHAYMYVNINMYTVYMMYVPAALW